MKTKENGRDARRAGGVGLRNWALDEAGHFGLASGAAPLSRLIATEELEDQLRQSNTGTSS